MSVMEVKKGRETNVRVRDGSKERKGDPRSCP